MAFTINVDDTNEAKIQTYLTFIESALTPEAYTQAFLDSMYNYDYDAAAKRDLIQEITALMPTFDGAGKTLEELQAIKADLDSWKA